MVEALDVVLRRTRPLFVASESHAGLNKRHRGQLFSEAVIVACAAHHIMVLEVNSADSLGVSGVSQPTKWDVAAAMAKCFPEVERKLPKRRKPWQGEDDRIGLFIALAVATVAWHGFRARGAA
jgi:hypothetical protein